MTSEERPPSGPPSGSASPSTSTPPPPAPKAFSLSLGGSKPKLSPLSRKPLTALKESTKRQHASTLDDSDEDETTTTALPELVSAFDHSAGGAITVNCVQGKAGPLVIPKLKNRDWREESRRKRGKNLLPPEVLQTRAGGDGAPEVANGAVQAYGLTFAESRAGKEADGDVEMATERTAVVDIMPARVKTDDELALEALTSEKGSGSYSTLVLPALEAQKGAIDIYSRAKGNHVSEDDAYRLDVASRPDPATFDDYAAVPVEDFGAALLRGMGWKEGDVVGKRKDQISKPRVVERRPALLGIGAKEVPGGIGEELGAWGKGAKKRGPGRVIDKTYTPVVLKNTKTGEMLTEEELKAKEENYDRVKKEGAAEEGDWRERRDRNLRKDLEKKEGGSRGGSRSDRDGDWDRHRRDRNRGREGGSSREGSFRRERSRSSDSRHRRRRDDNSSSNHSDHDKDRRRKDRDEERYDSSGSSRQRHGPRERSRHGERYDDPKSRRRQEVF